MVKDTLIKRLVNKWGTEKFVKVFAGIIIGASLGGLISESLTPNNPETDILEEKDND